MADGDSLPADHHAARCCFSDRMAGGRISFRCFELRRKDRGKLSVTWVECAHVQDRSRAAAARRLPAPRGGIDPADRIAFLKAGDVRAIAGARGMLDVVEDGRPGNLCHAAIVGAGAAADPELLDQEVATELAELAARDAPFASTLVRR